ncbi:hypothetical protein QQS21_004544 [Conoideocrella luteorostrata]|uniref:Polyketide synthase n=1 Tax=Conoideocrella luteorostrata TaxID=1105319 RepID=A0AAJ0FUJ1_9HYPO|nr:hypothetical protein QQS21_004544 [Conoideocrella luteorostrata]
MMNKAGVEAEEPHILLFGDLGSSGSIGSLRAILSMRNSPILDAFFSQVSFRLRQHIGNLPCVQQDLFPKFTTLVDLVAKYETVSNRGALQMFLLHVLQITQFIQRWETTTYPSRTKTFILSSCAGSLAAAAVGCANSMSSLIPLAVDSSLVAFKIGLKSYLAAEALSLKTKDHRTSSTSWSVAVSPTTSVSIEQLLDSFTLEKKGGIWLSATSPSESRTISGRPSILQKFVNLNKEKIKFSFLDITSPYHAPHIFSTDDVEDILDGIPANFAAAPSSGITALSASSKATTKLDFLGFLRQAISETLIESIDWSFVLEAFCKCLDRTGSRRCSLTSFSSNAATMISTTVSHRLGIEVVFEEASQPPPSMYRVTGRFEQSKIAIVGYSGRFPSAESNEEFWNLLQDGRDVHREIPVDRFNWRTHYDESGKKTNTSRIKHGCFIDNPGLFDARFFNMSPREADSTDPAHRLAILTTYEAMEMAGFVRNRTPSTQQDRVGVFFGTTSDDWREINASQNIDTYFIPGGNRAFAPGRISYFFRLSGPSLSIDTACSSSFAAIQTACRHLWQGECDTAIAGGTNVLTNPNIFSGLDRAHFLSTTGNCNAFDDGADGYCRADAVGSVILKRLEDAETDNDPILGVIVGAATNHCGQTGSITRPHEGDQANLFRQILQRTNYDPLDVNYVEMHGTGTQAGDATEMSSVLSVFVPGRERTSMRPGKPLYIGSAKANVGHAESASGVTSLIKVLQMLKHNEIPPHCGIKTRINHNYPLDLAERGVHIALKPTEWSNSQRPFQRAAFLNNFSAAGGNTAILLEEAPAKKHNDGFYMSLERRPHHLVSVTARSVTSLLGNIKALAVWLEAASAKELPALGYTTTARRTHHAYRVIVSGDSKSVILKKLTEAAARDKTSLNPISPPNKTTRVIFAFAGQGTLYHGMGRDLFEAYPSFRQDMLRLNRLAQTHGFPSFVGLIDGSFRGELEDASAVVGHLALVCVQIALVNLLGRWKVKPAAVIGHSLGEYPALYAAGVISAGDVVFLVGKRAMLLEKYCKRGTHGMVVVKASRSDTERLIKTAGHEISLACANHPGVHVVAGPKNQTAKVCAAASEAGLRTTELEIPFAFHSSQVDPILQEFEIAAQESGVVYHAPEVPVISPLLAAVVPAGAENALNTSYLVQACRSPVDFTAALSAAETQRLSGQGLIWHEVGAHPTCIGMIKETIGAQESVLATLVKGSDGCKTVTESLQALYLAGLDIDWNEYHREFPESQHVLELPHYAWDLKNYWLDYKNDFCVNREVTGMVAASGDEAQTKAPMYKYISPALQKVLEESHGSNESSIVAESDLFDERLLPVLQGHRVNGVALCPSSLYAEIALTLGDYFLQEGNMARSSTGLEIRDLKIDQPLVAAEGDSTHLFRVAATANWSTNRLSLSIFSVNVAGRRTTSHAMLTVQVVPDRCWLEDWKRSTYLITSRVKALEDNPNNAKLGRRMAYKLFSALVDYDPAFRGMSQVVLNSEEFEAVSAVDFQVSRANVSLGIDARWIDSLGQISGFIMNANDEVNSHEQVFINHGWARLRYAEPLDENKTYRTYCRMQHLEKTTYVGDAYVLDGDRVVGIYEGIKFVGMRRQVLNHVLPSSTGDARPGPKASGPKASGPAQRKPIANSGTDKPLVGEAVNDIRTISELPGLNDRVSSSAPSTASRVLTIVGREIGVAPSELHQNTQLADVGIDSLLSITICSLIRDELGVDIVSSALSECVTVADLQELCGCSGGDQTQMKSPSAETDNFSNSSYEDRSRGGSIPTPSEVSSSDCPDRDHAQQILLDLLVEETAAGMDELVPSCLLSTIGIDSLLALTISAKLGEILDISIPSSSIMKCDTISDLEQVMRNSLGIEEVAQSIGSLDTVGSERFVHVSKNHKNATPATPPIDDGNTSSIVTSPPHATSILLNGSTATAETIAFLFPDGSGSAASYAELALTFPKDIAVYGLNCPWRKTGNDLISQDVRVPDMVSKHLVELRRVLGALEQKRRRLSENGRFKLVLGGWSAGGILAIEAVRQLREGGTPVDKMMLIDAPNPIGLQNPPPKMFHFLDSIGILGAGKCRVPSYVLDHFGGMVKVLDKYEPRPLQNDWVPDSLIIYARDGVCKDKNGPKMETQPGDSREMLWLLNNRTEFSAAGWVSLLGSEKLGVEVIDDVNHFTMMEGGPRMIEMGDLLEQFVRRAS